MMVSGCDEPMARFWILTMEFGTRALGKCGWIFNRFYRCAAAAASGVALGFELGVLEQAAFCQCLTLTRTAHKRDRSFSGLGSAKVTKWRSGGRQSV